MTHHSAAEANSSSVTRASSSVVAPVEGLVGGTAIRIDGVELTATACSGLP